MKITQHANHLDLYHTLRDIATVFVLGPAHDRLVLTNTSHMRKGLL